MSSQITEAFVKQFTSNVLHLSQQKGSRLRGAVRQETQKGVTAFYDRIGKATALVRGSRHADTPQIDTPHSRRAVTMADYECADLIDNQDKIRLLINPESEYSQAFAWSLGRAMDDIILDQASGTAYSGETGGTAVTLPNGQKLASVASSAGAKLNVQALRRAKKILDGNDVDPMIPRFCAHNANQLENLLSETETTSADFNTVRALVMGQLDTFLGFKFIPTQQLNTQLTALAFDQSTGAVATGSGAALNYEKVLCWAQDGIILSVGEDIKGRITERADKSYSMQVYASMSAGGVRMEEEKVVEILCLNT